MMDSVKDFLMPKTFGILVYVLSIVHVLCGVVITAFAIDLNSGEADKFNCDLGPEGNTAYKTHVDKSCYSRYQQEYNSPFQFIGFVVLSIWFPLLVGVIYSIWARLRVQEIDSNNEAPAEGEAENQVQNRETLHVFIFYFFHLAIRVLSGILFTILQYVLIFPSGFDSEFSCSLPLTRFTTKTAKNASASQPNSIFFFCENLSASGKQSCWVAVSVLNMGFALALLMEIIHLLRNRYRRVRYRTGPLSSDGVDRLELTDMHESSTSDSIGLQAINLQESIDFYKLQVLAHSRATDVFFGQKTGLDNMYVDLAIHTEQARHNFSEDMQRHEIFDVYKEVPSFSIRLEKVKDLFYPEQDTKDDIPRTILVVGRPGIGKTALTEKIMRDWANGVDEFYHGKIVFYFKFRWFNSKEPNGMTLKTFLQHGTELSDEIFEIIYEYITIHHESAILIFDGLDEFNGNAECLDQLPPPNDHNICMSGISLSVKLISGRFLPGATVLVTSRPAANKFYSRFTFIRTVEIIGFNSDKMIEKYVSKFCYDKDRSNLKPKIWNHIKSSSNLLNLCYIPANCLTVSSILFECLSDPKKDAGALPTTLTQLYQAAMAHFDDRQNRKSLGLICSRTSKEAVKKLQLLAYDKIVAEPRQLIFDDELVDEEMKNSGLLNSLSNPYSQVQTQFCFIHLTIQEFLAAKHVTETFTQEEIKEFITSHAKGGKWHLVLQFIAGLLGKKNCDMNCVLGFAESLTVNNGILDLTDYSNLFVLKCLREVNHEHIAKAACETTALNDVVSLKYNPPLKSLPSTPDDWVAVTFVCKHMKKLRRFDLRLSHSGEASYLEVIILLQQKCIEQLTLVGSLFGEFKAKHLCKALVESKCSLEHEHCKLRELNIQSLPTTNEDLSTMCKFFKDGHASCLEKLVLRNLCGMSSDGVDILCEILNNEVFPELTYLDLSHNEITDREIYVLCHALQRQFKLTHLFLGRCFFLTIFGIPSLCRLISDERCNLAVLSLEGNKYITDIGLHILCKTALTKEHCKLTKLSLFNCSLTDGCIPELRETLQDEHCTLSELVLGNCKFTKIGKNSLRQLETLEHCRDRGLRIDIF